MLASFAWLLLATLLLQAFAAALNKQQQQLSTGYAPQAMPAEPCTVLHRAAAAVAGSAVARSMYNQLTRQCAGCHCSCVLQPTALVTDAISCPLTRTAGGACYSIHHSAQSSSSSILRHDMLRHSAS